MFQRILLSLLLGLLALVPADTAFAVQYYYDSTFGNFASGESTFDLGDTNSKESWALRVFERPSGAGYYILAKHGHGNGTWDAVVLAVDMQGRNEVRYLIPTPMFRLDDATYDKDNGRFYFVGGAKQAGHADSDFAITCLDISAGTGGAACSDFGSGGTVFTGFDLGGSKDDVARRVVSRSGTGIVVAGWAKDGANRYVFAVAAYYRNNGAPLGRFGSAGKTTFDVWQPGNATLDVNVYDLLLSDDTAENTTIYIAGNYSRVAAHNDYVALVWALRGWDGTLAPFGTLGVAQIPRVGDGSCASDCGETVGALALRHDRSLLFSGSARDANGNDLRMIGGLTASGQLDSRLCQGAGVCLVGYTFPGHGSGSWYSPLAAAEHPLNRDLMVVDAQYMAYLSPSSARYRTAGFIGNRDASLGSDYTATYAFSSTVYPPVYYDSYPAHAIWVGNARIEVGTYGHDEAAGDYRISLTRLIDKDTIFFDQFGGAHSD